MISPLLEIGAALGNHNQVGLCPWFEKINRVRRVWVHVGWGYFNAPHIRNTLNVLANLAVTDVVIDANRPNGGCGHGFDGGWHPQGTPEELIQRITGLIEAQARSLYEAVLAPEFDVHLLFHISPRRELLAGLNTYLQDVIGRLGGQTRLRSIILDAEHQQGWWRFAGDGHLNEAQFLAQFQPYQQQGFLADAAGAGIAIGATDYAMVRQEVSPAFRTLLRFCEFVMPQAYYGQRHWIQARSAAWHDPARLQVDHSHPSFAPHMDDVGTQLGAAFSDGSPMPQVVWLNAFDGPNRQVRYNGSWRGTMERELAALEAHDAPPEILEIAYWSFSGVAGTSARNLQRQDFIRCLSFRARQKHGFTRRPAIGVTP